MQGFDGLFSPSSLSPLPRERNGQKDRSVGWRFHFISTRNGNPIPVPASSLSLQFRGATNESIYLSNGRGREGKDARLRGRLKKATQVAAQQRSVGGVGGVDDGDG